MSERRKSGVFFCRQSRIQSRLLYLSGAPQGESSGCFGNQKKKKAMAANQANTGTL